MVIIIKLFLYQGFMYRSVKTIHPDVFCSNETVKNIVGIIGAQTSQVNIYTLLYIMLAEYTLFIIVNTTRFFNLF